MKTQHQLRRIVNFVLAITLALSVSLTWVNRIAYAGYGIFESYTILDTGSGNTFYDCNADTSNPDFDGNDLGDYKVTDTLTLNGAQVKAWENDGDNLDSAEMFYRLYLTSETGGSFTSVNLPDYLDLGGNDEQYEDTDAGINLLSGLEAGDYYLEVYFRAHEDSGGYAYDGNAEDAYQATFTVLANTSQGSGDWDAITWSYGHEPTSTEPVEIASGHTVALDGAANAMHLVVEGTLNLGIDTLTIADKGTLENNGTFTASNGTVAFAGDGTVAGTVTFNDVTLAGGVDFGASSTINGMLQINSGGYVDTNAPTYASDSILKYNTGGTYGRSTEWSGENNPYHVQFGNNTTLDLANSDNSTARTILGDLTIASGSTLNMGAGMNADLTIDGEVNIYGTLALAGGSGNLKVGGDFTKQSGGSFTNNGSYVYFNGGGSQNITGALSGSSNRFERIIVTNNSTVTFNNNVGVESGLQVDSGSTFQTSGTPNFEQEISDAGVLDCDGTCTFDRLIIRNMDASGSEGTIDVNENFVINNATSNFTAPSGEVTFTIAGGFDSNITSGTFDANGGTITFDAGTGTQDLDAASPIAFSTLAVTSGSTLVETQSANNVTATTISNEGTIRKTQSVAGTGAISFGLTGVEINVTTHGGLTNLQVDLADSDHAGKTSRIGNGKYWTITPTGLSGDVVTVTLPHNISSPNNVRACRYTGTGTYGWDCGTDAANSYDATTVTRTGVTAFSDWAPGDNVGPTAITIRNLTATSARNNWQPLALFLSAAIILAGTILLSKQRHKL